MLDTAASDAATGVNSGVYWTATVTNPTAASFGAGSFRFVQKISTARTRTLNSGRIQYSKYYGAWVLDNVDPYDDYGDFNGVNGWLTGGTHSDGDRPNTGLNPTLHSAGTGSDSFRTYLMYLPPGATSQFVPLQRLDWSYLISVGRVGATGWALTNRWTNVPNFVPQTFEPEWDAKLVNGEIFPSQ